MKNKYLAYLVTMALSFQIVLACSQTIQSSIVEKTPITINTTQVLTQIPSSTLEPSSSPTPTSMPTSSQIPLPTFTLQEKFGRIDELQKTNGGCDFPCWWGITPGITNWAKANNILSPIALKILTFPIENDIKMYYFEFPDASHNIIANIFVRDNGIVDVIRTGSDHSIADFLQIYGSPKEIWISSDGIVPGPSLFRIALFYPEKGVMAAYIGKASLILHNQVQYIKICVPSFNRNGPLWLWKPNSKGRFDELPTENLIGGSPTSLRLKRISEYTTLDEEKFYGSVLNDPTNTCLETKASIWPNPDFYITPTP